MPRNGNGTYALPANSFNPAVTATTIESSAWNATANDLASAMTQSVSKDGQTTMTGNLPMGNNKLTGLANGAAATDSIAYGQAAKLSGNNTFTGDQTINGSVSLSGSLTVTGPVIFTSGSVTVESLNVSSVASVKILNVASTASLNTLAVSSIASVNVLNVASTASVAGAITSQGVQVIPFIIPALRQNLKGTTAAGLTTRTTTFTADYLVLVDSSGNPKIVTGVNVTPDLAASGANGLDTGSPANNTWYYFWIINNGTATTAGTTASLISTSSTAPTMPAGYTYKALISARRTNGSANFGQCFFQRERRVWGGATLYVNPALAAGNPASPNVMESLSVSAMIPPIAMTCLGVMGTSNTGAETLMMVCGDPTPSDPAAANWCGLCIHNSDGATTLGITQYAGATDFEVPILTASTIYWTGAAGANHYIDITGFTI